MGIAKKKKTSIKKTVRKPKVEKKGEEQQHSVSKRAVEWSRANRFPFNARQQSVSICFDNHEDLTDLDFIYNKIVSRHPALMAEKFYSKVQNIYDLDLDESTVVGMLKPLCDNLLANIKEFLSDEDFIHFLYDRFGFGIDKVIQTLHAVYGYYFYTGKRTANAIKKTLDAYKEPPEH